MNGTNQYWQYQPPPQPPGGIYYPQASRRRSTVRLWWFLGAAFAVTTAIVAVILVSMGNSGPSAPPPPPRIRRHTKTKPSWSIFDCRQLISFRLPLTASKQKCVTLPGRAPAPSSWTGSHTQEWVGVDMAARPNFHACEA